MNADRPPLPAPGRVREITSFSNPAIKDIRALALKKQRDRQDAFLAEGLKLVIDALAGHWQVRTLILSRAAREQKPVQDVAARVMARGGDILVVPEKILAAIARRDNPQQVIAVCGRKVHPLASIRPEGNDVWVGLDRVRDPGNLGTILRTVDAVGAKGVMLIGDCTDPFGPEAVRATMGSLFAVPLVQCSEAEFLAWRRKFAGLVAATHLKGSVDYRSPDWNGRPVLLLMGNEQQGISDALAACADLRVRIPQAGQADSLNLSVSTGIMLYEIRRGALPREEAG